MVANRLGLGLGLGFGLALASVLGLGLATTRREPLSHPHHKVCSRATYAGMVRLLLLVSALGAAHAQLDPNSPWPMRGQNLRHTANGLVAPPDNSVVVVKYKTGGPISSSPAVDADGTVYFLSTDGFLYALEADGITLKWKYQPFDTSKVTEMYHMFSVRSARALAPQP